MQLLYKFKKSEYPLYSKIVLPYGVKSVKIRGNGGSGTILEVGGIVNNSFSMLEKFTFPIVNGKSPNTFTPAYADDGLISYDFLIEELGGIPDPNYFSDTTSIIPDEPTEQEVNNDAI